MEKELLIIKKRSWGYKAVCPSWENCCSTSNSELVPSRLPTRRGCSEEASATEAELNGFHGPCHPFRTLCLGNVSELCSSGYGSIPINTILSGLFTSILTQLFWCELKRGTRWYYWFWHTAISWPSPATFIFIDNGPSKHLRQVSSELPVATRLGPQRQHAQVTVMGAAHHLRISNHRGRIILEICQWPM